MGETKFVPALTFNGTVLKAIKKEPYDDWVDRLHYYFTVTLLLVFATAIGAQQIVGRPIQCWVSAEFRQSWEQYAETFCFISNTYYMPFEKEMPHDNVRAEDNKQIAYYQWIPIVLILQAILFYTPNILWKWSSGFSGININSMLRMSTDAAGFDPEKRSQNLATLSRTFSHSLKIRSALDSIDSIDGGCSSYIFSIFGFGRYWNSSGKMLTRLYVGMKILNLINVVSQFFLIDRFLGESRWFWGGQVFVDIIHGNNWTETGLFPRVTMCNFVVRHLGQNRRYTVQCALMINLWNEKIYFLIWCWFVAVTVFTSWNLIGWFSSCCGRSSIDKRMIRKYLLAGGTRVKWLRKNQNVLDSFVKEALKSDGVLLLKFISRRAGDLIATELVVHLFKEHLETIKYKEKAFEEMETETTLEESGFVVTTRTSMVVAKK